MQEVMEAAKLLRTDVPHLRLRVLNVVELSALDITRDGVVDEAVFNQLFTQDKPVIFNFHGYPSVIRTLLFGRKNTERIKVLGYIEEGTTTTPFKMLTVNKVSRFHVAMEAIRTVCVHRADAIDALDLLAKYQKTLDAHDKYIVEFGKDPEWLTQGGPSHLQKKA